MPECGLKATIVLEICFATRLEEACSMIGSVTEMTVSIVSTASMLDESASVCGSYLSAAEESKQKKMVTCARIAEWKSGGRRAVGGVDSGEVSG